MTRPVIRPPAVTPASGVAIVSTSSPIPDEELDRVVAYFENRGHPVTVAPHARAATGYLAGHPADRAADLMAAFADPSIGLIVLATGGKGAAQLLDLAYRFFIASPRRPIPCPSIVHGGTDTRPRSRWLRALQSKIILCLAMRCLGAVVDDLLVDIVGRFGVAELLFVRELSRAEGAASLLFGAVLVELLVDVSDARAGLVVGVCLHIGAAALVVGDGRGVCVS
jgi:hypothetical protein